MGCASSKQKRCRHCHAPYSPVPRSYSVHVHHPPQAKDDSYHLVGLTSTTLGSLMLDLNHHHHKLLEEDAGDDDIQKGRFNLLEEQRGKQFSKGFVNGIVTPKTPTRTPPGEPETIINTWELMEGLEDISTTPLRSPNHLRSFSFDVLRRPIIDPPKPVWPHDNKEKVKVVVYFTSLRGIRKTYEDCCHVRTILKGVGVRVDERDVSMHSGFKEELKELLGDGFGSNGGGIVLPRVFVGGDCVGGVEEIRKLHENGELEKLLECCEKIDDGVCEGCGDIRFVPCETCSGSWRIGMRNREAQQNFESSAAIDASPAVSVLLLLPEQFPDQI
ncbi:Glutaredoxin family protein [Senna tora]|uniref:Glutaredoxin family protein n=1 Tax=Senna tora TaxID=362788 RepID=A0A834WDV4_9FABA|nr:Glutaredoxin family protein [Senna tora]